MTDSASDHGGLSVSEAAFLKLLIAHIERGGRVTVDDDGNITLLNPLDLPQWPEAEGT